jgi:hypothetical protein
MLVAKPLADLITFTRAALSGVLIWLGISRGAEALPLVCWLMIADWMGDALDGPIARRSRVLVHTWIGDHDLEVDITVSFALLIYLLAAGYVDLRIAAVYLLIWALVFWRWGVPRSLGMLIQAPIYGWFLWVAMRDAPQAGGWVIGWIIAVIVVTWPKFPREVVPGFLSGMRDVVEKYRRG